MTEIKDPVDERPKALSGIFGFDEITHGGLPRNRATLILGGPGSGKTVLALQTLINGARLFGEPGIFVAFEENSRRIIANAETFGWNIPALEGNGLFFLDAQPSLDLLQSGDIDLGGMLAALQAKAREIGAKRIVFDAIDVVLSLVDGPPGIRREIFRLQNWLLEQRMTAIITAKSTRDYANPGQPDFNFIEFMVDCSVELNHDIRDNVSRRTLRVQKYRGSSFEENALPLIIGGSGVQVAVSRSATLPLAAVTTERVSSGIERLDTMLGGGYFRGSSILLTGAPGTAKTTLAGTFIQAACERGEKALFVSFDSAAEEIVRNLAAVNIPLAKYIDAGLLHISSARSTMGSNEIHVMRIRELSHAYGAKYIVVDPISALANSDQDGVSSVVERLIDWSKAAGITMLCTSLLDRAAGQLEGTPMAISTVADTWIHLNYVVRSGERNRGLSIIKSRGTAHSNQVRELLLSDQSVTLADVYTAEGEVLMGTLRWQKERADRLEKEERTAVLERQRRKVQAETAELQGRLTLLQKDIDAKHAEIAYLDRQTASYGAENDNSQSMLHDIRQGDDAVGQSGRD